MTAGPMKRPQSTLPPSWVTKLQPSKPHGPDLLSSERQNSVIDPNILANVLHTKEAVEIQRRVLGVLQNDDAFDKTGNYFGSRLEQFKTSLARGKRLHQLQQAHRWNEQEFACALELIGDSTAYAIHWKGFLAGIREQGTPEQHELFLRRAEKMEIIGCFCQTELGHGSNVRKLETTATWDPSDQTFILHSPHLTASKWWAGTLGRTANYAIIMAQLIIAGKEYGPHPFVCQIRDLVTHEPLDGIYVGDIGPKFGYNTVDNGFLVLNQVKIPHVNMLSRHSRVDPKTNTYIPPESPAHIYVTLTKIRCALVLESARNMARGLTIAIRYSAVRCQFQDPAGNPAQTGETQVLDYTMVQYRLLPLLAESLALNFTGQATIAFHAETKDAGKVGANSRKELLAELHATSCGLKAYATSAAAQGLELCRRACGGHGFSSFSGIGNVFKDYVASQTYEGDNYVLGQQTANYLLKQAQMVTQGNTPESIAGKNLSRYAAAKNGPVHFSLDSDEDLVAVFGWRAAYLTFKTQSLVPGKTRNQLQVAMWKLCTAHCQFLVIRGFYERLAVLVSTSTPESQLDAETREVLWKLFRLYAFFLIQSEPYDFFASKALQVEQLEHANTIMFMQLLADIRLHAVKLVDAWNLPDWLLDSSLGRYDGKVYEDLFHRATQLNPLNRISVDPRPYSSTIIKDENVNGARSNL